MSDLLEQGQRAIADWEAAWLPFATDATLEVAPGRAEAVLAELGERLRDNYPFFHPCYAGQMLKPPHPVAIAAYAMAMRINPNNHALDGGPATSAMEREVVAELASMFGYDPATSLGHLTSSGTIANLEALWVARELHPEKGIAYSTEAHYTHGRMAQVLGMNATPVVAAPDGRIDLDDLRAHLRNGQIGTVVATAGTTSIGAVDPVGEILALAREHGARVHVDAAYGGFFRLLAAEGDDALRLDTAAAVRAIAGCDSVVVDPHKHALQPYGCGSVLFRDAGVGRFYVHDSPYTYFTSDELHLGEISLECSRAGAAAAALWATLRCFPLAPRQGLGAVLRQTRAAALAWADRIAGSAELRLLTVPELDLIVAYPLPPDGDRRVFRLSALTRAVFARGMRERAFYLATLRLGRGHLAGPPHEDLIWDAPEMLAFRSDLMKPEHRAFVPELHERVTAAIQLEAAG
jgi:glutamate/tyrosine decarboxylase-like PLP-dependent enzyme